MASSSMASSERNLVADAYASLRAAKANLAAAKSVSGVTKRKRRGSKKKRTYKRRRYNSGRRPYQTRGRGVVMTPYGTLTGLGTYNTWGRDMGAAVGGHLGGMAQNAFRNLTGLGEYKVKMNTLWDGTDPPQVVNTFGEDATIIRHREYLGDLRSGKFPVGGSVTDFVIGQWTIQPGNPALFPWLSTIADNYQEYEMRGMIIELKTLTSDFSDKSVLGSFFMGTQYNVLEPAPASKRQLENLQYSTSSKPSESMIHAIECAPNLNAQTHLYVAQDGVVKTGDSRLYDLGNIFIGSQGIPVEDAPIAEIWCSYEVALFKPQLGVPLLATWQFRNYNKINNAMVGVGLGQTLVPDKQSYSGISVRVDTANDDILYFSFPDLDSEWDIFWYIANTSLHGMVGPTITFDPGVKSVKFIPDVGNVVTPVFQDVSNWDALPLVNEHYFFMRIKVTSQNVDKKDPGFRFSAVGQNYNAGAHANTIIINRVSPEVYDGTNY
nr:putative capsid protein [Crucivirus sp.]